MSRFCRRIRYSSRSSGPSNASRMTSSASGGMYRSCGICSTGSPRTIASGISCCCGTGGNAGADSSCWIRISAVGLFMSDPVARRLTAWVMRRSSVLRFQSAGTSRLDRLRGGRRCAETMRFAAGPGQTWRPNARGSRETKKLMPAGPDRCSHPRPALAPDFRSEAWSMVACWQTEFGGKAGIPTRIRMPDALHGNQRCKSRRCRIRHPGGPGTPAER